MPYLKISTNISLDKESKISLATKGSVLLSQILNKPESYIMVEVKSNSTILFAGKTDAAAYLELKSIGLPESGTKALSAQLCDYISTQLEVPSDRIYIEFSSAAKHLWGWNNSTF